MNSALKLVWFLWLILRLTKGPSLEAGLTCQLGLRHTMARISQLCPKTCEACLPFLIGTNLIQIPQLVKKNLDFGLKLGIPAIVLSVTTSVSIPTIDARRVTKLRESCGTCHELLLFQDLNVGDK